MAFYRVAPEGIVVTVRLTPKGGRDSIDGGGRLSDGSDMLQVRVRALPAEDAANKALVAMLAKALRVPKSAVTIISGRHARIKQVKIAGKPRLLAGEIERWSNTP
jgi:uncharacterized protein